MEEDLNFLVNERQPQFLFVNGRRPHLLYLEDELNFIAREYR